MNAKMSEGFQLIHDIFRLKWIPEIIEAIATDKNRYTDIQMDIEYISNTELNRKLLMLQERQVIIKETIDAKEGYYLTEFGKDLNHVFKHFVDMSDKYISQEEQIKFI